MSVCCGPGRDAGGDGSSLQSEPFGRQVDGGSDSPLAGGPASAGRSAADRGDGAGRPTAHPSGEAVEDARGTRPIGTSVALDGGRFRMGTDGPEAVPGDGEGPARDVVVAPFRIARTTVTVGEFAAFVQATGHRTDAELHGWSFVFHLDLPADHPPTHALAAAPWWRQVHGADWAHPAGPASSTAGRDDHPVVHVSRRDAEAYAAWIGGRLPSEAEWEFAARGGLAGARYPWGDDLKPGGAHVANLFQGDFPLRDTGDDGFAGTAPVDAFPPNGFGLYNVAGNVWEWCADRFEAPNASPGEFVVRGGSHLCHRSYCDRYRVAARTGNTPDSSLSHTGFRVAYDR